MDLGGRGIQVAKGLGLLVVGLAFTVVLFDFWDWSFDGTPLPPAVLSLWLLGMALVCLWYGAQSLFRAAKR